jgi:hypothetical protein
VTVISTVPCLEESLLTDQENKQRVQGCELFSVALVFVDQKSRKHKLRWCLPAVDLNIAVNNELLSSCLTVSTSTGSCGNLETHHQRSGHR